MANFRPFNDVERSILGEDVQFPRQNDIMQAPAYVWESAPHLWQTPDTSMPDINDARALRDEIMRKKVEQFNIYASPWMRKLGEQ